MRPERRVDLHKLPVALQYVIALATVAVVVALVFAFGDRDPGPSWLTDTLPPILGAVGLVIVAVYVIMRARRRR